MKHVWEVRSDEAPLLRQLPVCLAGGVASWRTVGRSWRMVGHSYLLSCYLLSWRTVSLRG